MSRKEIDISNYEEWFIDHLDGKLSEAEEEQLNSFLLTQPELAEELEGLDSVKLQAKEVSFDGKDELLMPTVDEFRMMAIAEEGSLAGLQGLSEREMKDVKAWKNTILQPDESIVYPDRSSLLKEQSTPIIPLWLVRVAIAASVVGVVSWAFFRSTESIYEPREGLVNSASIDVDALLRADYTEFNYQDSGTVNSDPVPIRMIEEVQEPMIAEQELEVPEELEETPIREVLEIPEEPLAERPDVLTEEQEESKPILEEPMPFLSENETPNMEEEKDIPEQEEDILANASAEESPKRNTNVKVYNSVFDFLKGTVQEKVEESDLFAMEEVKEEDDYVKTSLRIGSFEFSRGRRKNR